MKIAVGSAAWLRQTRTVGVAFFQYGDPNVEAYGLRLANSVSARLRAAFDLTRSTVVPHGPDFRYEDGPDLFLSRRGVGPLHVVWDTNLLIDYFQHGRALWDLVSMSDVAEAYGDELEALQLIFGLWILRDIRFHVLPRVLSDAKRRLPSERLIERQRALEQFSSALGLVESGDPELDTPSRAGLLILPRDELDNALKQIPMSDQALVRDAARFGAHVFLTRDKGVLACRRYLRPFGLLLSSPGDLLTELVGCGAFHCLMAPQYAYWPLPDQARVTHLVNALPTEVTQTPS